MNTAARMLEACRETGCSALASVTLLDRLSALPAGVEALPLGPLPMRGKERALELFALETGCRDGLAPERAPMKALHAGEGPV